jgi:single-strand DNA-binding protein
MANLNITHIIGRATREPELRVTPKGTAICTFSLAVNRKFKAEDGADREEVFYAECESWSKAAETIAKYVKKGDSLYVQGRLKTESWNDKTTQEKRSRTKLVVENFQFLGGKNQSSSGGEKEPNQSQDRSPAPSSGGGGDSDVPFMPIHDLY